MQKTSSVLDGELKPALQIIIQDKPARVKKAWKSYLDRYYQIDMKNKGFMGWGKTMAAEDIEFREITYENIDLYTKVYPTFNGSEMNVFVEVKDGTFVSKIDNPLLFRKAQYVISEFAKEYNVKLYEEKTNEISQRITSLEINSNNLMSERLKIRDELKENLNEIQELNQENLTLREEISELQDKYHEIELMLERQKQLLQQYEEISDELSRNR